MGLRVVTAAKGVSCSRHVSLRRTSDAQCLPPRSSFRPRRGSPPRRCRFPPPLPVYHATYGAYGAKGYLFAHNQASVYCYNPNGTRSEFLTASPGFNDVEFGANRTLYVADLYNGLYEVKPSPKVFSDWLEATRCPLISDLGDVVDSWQVGGSCPGPRCCASSCASPRAAASA